MFAVILFSSLGIGVNMYRFGYGVEDGFYRTLMFPFEGTVWAQGFNEKAFLKVQIGMSQLQVVHLLGEPLRKDLDCDESCFWLYSGQDSGTADFDQRWVVFGADRKVNEIRKSFFID